MDGGALQVPVIVTRPAREAARWVQALARHGVPAQALPLIAIGPAPHRQAVAQAAHDLPACAAAMFVSANAVQGFFESDPALARIKAGQSAITTRAWATGPGTREALLAAGWPAGRIDAPPSDAAQFDSEALWERVRDQVRPGARVLIVRGADADAGDEPAGRDWLAQQLQHQGADVRLVASYARARPAWDEAQRALASRAAGDGSWWLFSSSQAVRHLQDLLPGPRWSQARAVATHPRIADAASAAGFGEVAQIRPGIQPLVGFLQSRG